MSTDGLEPIEGDVSADVVAGEHYPAPIPGGRRLDLNQSRYVSQLPSPDDLERYNELIPNVGERLLSAGEREQLHRHQIENRLVALDEEAMPKFYRGQAHAHIVSAVLGRAT